MVQKFNFLYLLCRSMFTCIIHFPLTIVRKQYNTLTQRANKTTVKSKLTIFLFTSVSIFLSSCAVFHPITHVSYLHFQNIYYRVHTENLHISILTTTTKKILFSVHFLLHHRLYSFNGFYMPTIPETWTKLNSTLTFKFCDYAIYLIIIWWDIHFR